MALTTGAIVFAGTGIQHMARYQNLPNGRFILRGWRGQLLRFDPEDGSATLVTQEYLDFDFNNVMARRR